MASVKAITQDTFDSVVKENINDFEMDNDEAVQDAIKQFESQGVNLSMIIKAVSTENGHEVLNLIKNLKLLLENATESDNVKVAEILKDVVKLFRNDLANRYQASKIENAHAVLYKACLKYKDTPAMLKCCVTTFAGLLEGQPDLITVEGLQFTLQLLEKSEDSEMVSLLLRILRSSCTKHEGNRINLVLMKGIEIVLKTAEKFKDSASITKEACGVLRSLTLDDDVRVQFGKAHEHTKLIVTEHSGLERLFKFIEAFEQDASVTKELYSTLSKLLVRSEFCQQMVDLGGLEVIFKTVDVHMNQQNVVRQCVTLLKAMSGNDDVKVAVVKAGGVQLLLKVLSTHNSSPQICEACFAALTTLALRNPSHCDVIMASNAAVLMTEAMRQHSDHSGVQKQACMAIRNLVARTRHHSRAFIEQGAETLIRKARTRHKAALDDQGKAALRDLDVDVELEERWKGANPGVTS